MGSRRLTETRLRTILSRQDPVRWGADYLPSIMVTHGEVPSISRCCPIWSPKLGRDMHLLSPAERTFAILALYHPQVAEIHEQKMLHPLPQPHPATGFRGRYGLELRSMRGLVAVAKELGYLDLLATVSVASHDGLRKTRKVVFPFLGDFLLFLVDEQDALHCINWSIKNSEEGFKRQLQLERLNAASRSRQDEEVVIRQLLEEIYYQDANIKSHFLSPEKVDRHVVNNLVRLHPRKRPASGLSPKLQHQLIDLLRRSIGSRVTPIELILDFSVRWNVKKLDCQDAFYQAVWERVLRVDLFSEVLIDVPLRAEERDVLDVYSKWFR
jgi:hypothetical protein